MKSAEKILEKNDFSISALSDFIGFAKRYEIYGELCRELEISEDYFETNSSSWESIDFLEKFFRGLFEVYNRNHDKFDPSMVLESTTPGKFLSEINKETIRKKRQPFFRFALSIFFDPKMVWHRLPYLVASTIKYSRVEYEHSQDTILYSSGKISQYYNDPDRHETNMWLSEMCLESIKGLADALGATLVYVERTKSVIDGDDHCEYELRWIRKTNYKIWVYGFCFFAAMALAGIFLIPGLGVFHSVGYSALLSMVVVMLVKESSNFSKTDEAFHQQRETMLELVERGKIQKKLNTELMKTQNELEKTVLLAAAGEVSYGYLHDMASSISIILMSTKVLSKNMQNQEIMQTKGSRYIGMVETAAERLVKMQNFIRRSVTSWNSTSRSSQKINESLNNTLEIIGPLVESKQMTLVTNIGPTEDFTIHTFEGMLEGVTLNLLNNSINALETHRVDGVIELNTKLTDSELTIEIKDNGPGIPDEVLSNIWDPFDSSSKPAEPGKDIVSSGFGLYKIKKSIDKMKGKIDVKTSESGTTFTMKFALSDISEMVAAS